MSTLAKQHPFILCAEFAPAGDQPSALESLVPGFAAPKSHQVLLGVTGSGKTFTVASAISQLQIPTLVIAHNKTLAAQLYEEFKSFFPNNAVEYFVSYYDYYQPEAYVPSTDTFIDKDATINDAIDRMRHSATQALFERNDVIIVSSVSCIYGLGSAEAYYGMHLKLNVGDLIDRDEVLLKLANIQFERNDTDFHRGTFRVRGDVVEVFPAHQFEQAYRIEWFGDEIESIAVVDPLRGVKIRDVDKVAIFPTSHYVVTPESRDRATNAIRDELRERLIQLRKENKLVEAQRLEQRTLFDLEMIEEMGYCTGIENYSRHLTGRPSGLPPPTLVDYLGKEFLLVIDESHQTVPQLGAMYRGDRARKENLVNFGFRLPSALDNRPLQFEEFRKLTDRVLYVSATPGDFELEDTQGVIVEQIIRPTGLIDPQIDIRPVNNQVDDLLEEIRVRESRQERVLVTVLTKRMAEDLTEYYADVGVRVRYLHSDIDTLERIQVIHDLRAGQFDVLVGINLLREGLDLPEVSLVAILDADKEGFLRSDRSLIQTIGRAARHVEGKAILYADRMTQSIQRAVDETVRRRQKQETYNQDNNITPKTVQRKLLQFKAGEDPADTTSPSIDPTHIEPDKLPKEIEALRKKMLDYAESLEFEKAAELRDQVRLLEEQLLRLT
uniref:UvrABC system protein B n=1 Tax=uncultured myxobacterium HF0130_06F04 TaxID=723555 RepID=E7C2H0_9BACT|nr:helicase subunit of the DNA excision repair complex [uncultured myxobacterium HF0130_06F04]